VIKEDIPLPGQFHGKFQTKELKAKNKWIFTHTDKTNLDINGDDITEIKKF
jgi:hypothetical protein